MISSNLKTGARLIISFALALAVLSLCDHPAQTHQEQPPREGPGEAAGVPEGLEGRDCYGDSLPEAAIARLGTVRLRHDSQVESIAISPDGSLLASADARNTVRVWEADSGREVARFAGRIRARAVAFSTDGKKLLIVNCPGIIIQEWDVKLEILLREVKSGEDSERHGNSAIICSDSQLAIVTDRYFECTVYDMKSGKRLLRLKKDFAAFVACALTHDGRTLATSGNEKVIHLWDVASSKEIRQLPLPDPDYFYSLQFSLNDGALAVAGQRALHVFEVRSGKEILSSQDIMAVQLAYSTDGKILAALSNSVVRLLDTATWKETRQLKVAPRGKIDDKGQLAFSADSKRLAAVGFDHSVHVWNMVKGTSLAENEGHHGTVLCVSVSPNNKTVVSGGDDGSLCVWDRNTGRLRRCISVHTGSVTCAVISPDGRMVATGDGIRPYSNDERENVRIWDLETGKLIREFSAHRKGVYCLAFSPDGQTLASAGGDTSVRLWDPKTGKERQQLLTATPTEVSLIAFSNDGNTLAIRSTYVEIANRHGDTWEIKGKFCYAPDQMYVGLLPDGKGLVTAEQVGEDEVRITNLSGSVAENKTIRLPFDSSTVDIHRNCALSPNGRLIAIAEDGQPIHLYDVQTGKALLHLSGHRGCVTSLAFSPDGAALVSGSADTTVLLWDLEQAQFNRRWRDLASENDALINEAIQALIATPRKTVPYLARRLLRAAALEVRVAHLVDDLDDDSFESREKASQLLLDLGLEAEFALRQAFRLHRSAEVKKRVGEIIDRLMRSAAPILPTPAAPLTKQEVEDMLSGKILEPKEELTPEKKDERTFRRALDVLALIRTPEAREALSSLARGDDKRWFTKQAAIVLQGLEKQGREP